MKRIIPLLLLPALAHASLFATGGTETVLGDNTAVHTFTSDGVFTLSETKMVRILVVGGGGGGGAECGGGGGGGGVIEEMAYELPAGTYGIAIGAGGTGGRQNTDRGNGNERGGNGGDTVVTNAVGTELFRAFGGGGGGGWANRSGIAGGSGGGAAANGSGGATLDSSQGNAAGNAAGGGQSLPTGGGGAGAASEDVTLSKGNGYSGTGGAGRTSDISGTAQMYGAGGGGGNYNYSSSSAQAPGGDGVGGFGQGNTNSLQENMKGRDGFGGGGGGGSNVGTYIAGDGGSGVVVIRLANSDGASPTPVFLVTDTTVGCDNVVFAVSVSEAGSGASDGTVSVVAQIAEDASAWDAQTGAFSGTERTLATGLHPGSASLRVVGLRPSHSYVAKIVVRNDEPAETVSDPISFSTTGLSDPRWTMDGRTGEPGLWQLRFGDSGSNDIGKEFDESTAGITVQVGTIAAGLANGHDNAIHGRAYTDAAGNVWTAGGYISYAYLGWMWMEAGTTYTFFEFHYDGARLEIDGTDVIRNTDWSKSSTGTYACQETGWHRIRAWLTSPGGSNLGVPPNWSLSLGWNTNGVTDLSGKPGADWMPLENTAQDVYLRTEPVGRTVDVSSWSADTGAGTATFEAALGAGTSAADLYAVWGAWHGGDTTNGWPHVERVGSAAVGPAAATASFTVPDLSDLTWFRFVAIDDAGLCAWSASQVVDLSNPTIAIAGVTHDGDLATVSIRVDSVGTGDFSLRLLWGENADLSGASVTNVSVSGTGVYDVTVPVEPGATTYYRAEAATTDGGNDATSIGSFTTLAGSDVSETKSATVSQHWITFSGRLDAVGAGTTTVTLWMGESADALVADPEPIVVTSLTPFSFRRLVPGVVRTIYWKLTCDNAGAGGTPWTDSTAVGTTAPSEEGIVYTWKADVAEGEWKDTNNWTTATAGAFGYPAYTAAWAAFPNGSTNRIHLAGYVESRLRLQYTDGSVTVFGDDPDSSYLYTGDTDAAATLNRSTFTLDAVTLSEWDAFDFTVGGASTTGSRLVATNGASFVFGGGREAIRGAGSGYTVCAGSAIHYHDGTVQTNKTWNAAYDCYPLFAALGESLTLDGGVFSANEIYVATPEGEAGQRFRIRGPGGQLRVCGGVFGDLPKASTTQERHGLFYYDQPFARDLDVVFEPVDGSYTNTVVYEAGGQTVTNAVPFVSVSDEGRALGAMLLEESVGKIRFSADDTSMRRSSKSAKGHFVLWKTGIDTNHVELVQGDSSTLSYTYGWPSTRSAPETPGDLPTGIRGNVTGGAGTLILFF